MPSAIDRIRSKNKPPALRTSPATSAAMADTLSTGQAESISPPAAVGENTTNTITDTPSLPPPIPCLFCSCPAIWSTIYEPQAWLCCDCDPPPGGKDGADAWHWQRGGWSFVARRLMLVVDRHLTTAKTGERCEYEKRYWENFPRTDLRGWEVEVVVEREAGTTPTLAEPASVAAA